MCKVPLLAQSVKVYLRDSLTSGSAFACFACFAGQTQRAAGRAVLRWTLPNRLPLLRYSDGVAAIAGAGLDSSMHARRHPCRRLRLVKSARANTTQHNAKTVVVVSIVCGVPVATGTAQVPGIVVPGSAAHPGCLPRLHLLAGARLVNIVKRNL